MAASKHSPRAPKVLAPELLDGAFIEENLGKAGRTEYRMYFPKAVMRIRATGDLGRDKCGPSVQDLTLKLDGDMPQNFFGMVIDSSVAEALKGQVPYIRTGHSAEDRVDEIKIGIRCFRIEQEAKAAADAFCTQHPELSALIAQQGYLMSSGYVFPDSVLLLPPKALEEVESAFRSVAPDAKLGHKAEDTRNPFTKAEGLEIDHPTLLEIVNRLVPKERIRSSFDAEVMALVATAKPEAMALKARIEENQELTDVLRNKAYFFTQPGMCGRPPQQGAIIFAQAEDAERCLALLKTIPGFEAARSGDKHNPPWVPFPKIDLANCDLQSSLALPGFAGEANEAGDIGLTQMQPRRSSNAHRLMDMLQSEHPDHQVFREESRFGFR